MIDEIFLLGRPWSEWRHICSTLQKIKEDLQYTANVLLAVTASDDNEIFGKDEPSAGLKDHRNPPDHGISDGGVNW